MFYGRFGGTIPQQLCVEVGVRIYEAGRHYFACCVYGIGSGLMDAPYFDDNAILYPHIGYKGWQPTAVNHFAVLNNQIQHDLS
jgi:hypothetical protein